MYLCLMANALLFHGAGVLFSLVLQLGLEKGAVVAQLVVVGPVLLRLLKNRELSGDRAHAAATRRSTCGGGNEPTKIVT